ncbi:putative proton-coupled zinc antiporter SLC30A4 isoform X2 [Canis aureus]
MAGSSAWKRLKSLLRKDDAPLFLNDTSAFDFSDEVGDEGLSRFNKLRVVVADDGSEIPERPINGAHPALQADDDSLLDQDLPLANSQLSLKVDPCDNCSRQRELLKQRKVKTRLTIAAVLYLLFMIGELVGGYIANSLAIMTDALHMLTDLSAIILTLLALWLSSKSPTKRFTFGFHRLALPFCKGPFPCPSALNVNGQPMTFQQMRKTEKVPRGKRGDFGSRRKCFNYLINVLRLIRKIGTPGCSAG